MKEVPDVLYHRVISSGSALVKKVQSILEKGLTPRKPDEWKGLLPAGLQDTPIVWLTAGVHHCHGGRVFSIETRGLSKGNLHHLDLKDVDWWVYTGVIPPWSLKVG